MEVTVIGFAVFPNAAVRTLMKVPAAYRKLTSSLLSDMLTL